MEPHESMTGTFQPQPNTVLDPVCGMYVDPQKARGSAEHKGKTYHFCSPRCVERFNAEPEKYLAPRAPASGLVQLGGIAPARPPQTPAPGPPKPGKGKVTYVCPMDPEVRESKPVPCPVCGMALEPERVEDTCPMQPEINRAEPSSLPMSGLALTTRVCASV